MNASPLNCYICWVDVLWILPCERNKEDLIDWLSSDVELMQVLVFYGIWYLNALMTLQWVQWMLLQPSQRILMLLELYLIFVCMISLRSDIESVIVWYGTECNGVFCLHDGIWYRDASTHDIAVGKVNAQKDIRLELDNDDCALLSAGRTKDWSMFNLNWCQLVVGETGASEKFYHAMQLFMMSPQKCPGVLWMSAMKWLGRSSSAEECFQMPVMSSKCYAVPSSAMPCLQVLCGACKCCEVPSRGMRCLEMDAKWATFGKI